MRVLLAVPGLTLLSGDCGSGRNPDAGGFTDPIVLVLTGTDSVAFNVVIHLASSKLVSADAEIWLESVEVNPTPHTPLIVTLSCEGDENWRDLSMPPFRRMANVVSPVTSPGEVTCLVRFTPESELDDEIEVTWHLSTYLEWGYDERHTQIEVAIEVTRV